MECYSFWDILGDVCGVGFFVFVLLMALFKKPPFPDDEHSGGIHP